MTDYEDSEVQIHPVAGIDALVTGSSRGLGLGIARALASGGATVWMTAEGKEELLEAAEMVRGGEAVSNTGGHVETRVVDLCDRDACIKLVSEVRANATNLRVLVNNAAVLEREAIADLDFGNWDRTLAVNLTAPTILCREIAPVFAESGGSIINVSSRAGRLAFKAQAAYCASKFGVEAMTRCLAIELAGAPVSVNTVTPGLRIKPTSLKLSSMMKTVEHAGWHDPIALSPAFLFLSGLRGPISGYRFDAQTLTCAIESYGLDNVVARIDEFAEHIPRDPKTTT